MTRAAFPERLKPWRPFIGVILLVTFWWGAAVGKMVDPILLPSPTDAFEAWYTGMSQGLLWNDFVVTFNRTMIAFSVACVIAIPLGIVLGAAEGLYRSVEFIIDFFRSTPASAMFPLFLVLFGSGDKTKILVASFGAALVILFNVAYGVMNARKVRLQAARVMGASSTRLLRDVLFWEALPATFIGMRSGISLALVIVIVAEMFIGSSDGLGYRLIQAQMIFEMPLMYASIFTAGALGYFVNWAFLMIERRVVHWGGK